jgi:hypothetical protein
VAEKKETTFFRQKLELLLLSDDAQIAERVGPVISRYHISFKHLPDVQTLNEQRLKLSRPQLILLKQGDAEDLAALNVRISGLMRTYPKTSVLVVRKNAEDDADAGEKLVARASQLSANEFYSTAKLEFVLLEKIRSPYFSLLVTDLFPSTTVTFSASMRMVLNQRYLPVVIAGRVLSDQRFQRLQNVERIYFPTTQATSYFDYIQTYYDTSGVGLRKRVRALYLQFVAAAIDVFEYTLLDLENLDESEIEKLYSNLVRRAGSLIGVLEKSEDPWDILRDAEDNEFLSLWRAPMVAAFAAVMSIKSNQGDPLTALLVGFFAELGMWQLTYDFFRRYQEKGMLGVLANEKSSFESSPMNSLNRLMAKAVPLDEAVKSALVCVMERVDGKGFPNQTPADKIPVEALLARFAIGLERQMRTVLEQTGVSFRFMREKYWEEAKKDTGDLGEPFITAVANSLV